MTNPIVKLFLSVVAITAMISGLAAADPPRNVFFDQQIAPLLSSRCLSCHNATEKKGELDLSRKATTQAGGESGAAIKAGDFGKSLLWQRIADDEMPPRQPLSVDEKELVRQWIAAGAVWGTDPIDPFRFSSDERGGYDWWSLQAIDRFDVPQVTSADWPRNEVDRFVLSKLQVAGLAPAEQADGRILLRRLYFDLIGLPPILKEAGGVWQEEVLGIAIDPKLFPGDSVSYAAVVDALLNSPHYGERWGRHWLDVIRFGESQGFERNRVRHNAWRYRDWVIQALNADMPYDQFIRQQIAGDVLEPDSLDALIATGFLVCGTYDMVGYEMGSEEMKKAVRQDELEDMVAALGQSMLGLTINCARCHDHKFDPISQREYYQVAALLGGVTQEENERQGITLKPGDEGDENAVEGLQVLYLPGESAGKQLEDRSGVGCPLNLHAGGKPPFASGEPATKLIAAVKATNEFAIEAWLTPGKADQSGAAGCPSFADHEFVHVKTGRVRNVIENPTAHKLIVERTGIDDPDQAAFHERLIHEGTAQAGQVRSFGYLALLSDFTSVKTALKNAISSLNGVYSSLEKQLGSNNRILVRRRMTIFVVFSNAGGTASSMALAVMAILRALTKGMPVEIVAVMIMPSTFDSVMDGKPEQAVRIGATAFATMLELDAARDGFFNRQQILIGPDDRNETSVPAGLFNQLFVAGRYLADGRDLQTPEAVYDAVALHLAAVIGTEISDRVEAEDANQATLRGLTPDPMTGRSRYVSAMAAQALALPVGRIAKHCASRQLIDFINQAVVGDSIAQDSIDAQRDGWMSQPLANDPVAIDARELPAVAGRC